MLSNYRVLDLPDERGELASMIFGDLGSDVIKIEPPQGSSSRYLPPLLADGPEAERSLRFFAYNRSKRSVCLDLTRDHDRDVFLTLVRDADFLFESAEPHVMKGLGLDFETLSTINTRLVYVGISPFGQDGPYADHRATDITLAAMGGSLSLQGVPERAPVRVSVPQAWLHASAEAAVGALIAHTRMRQTGAAQFVDVSAQAAMTWTMPNATLAHSFQGKDMERAGSDTFAGVPKLCDCADGRVILATMALPRTLDNLVRWLVKDGLAPAEWLSAEDWSTYGPRLLRSQPLNVAWSEVRSRLQDCLARYTQQELLELGFVHDATMAPVFTVAGLQQFPHLKSRAYWQTSRLPDGREVATPGMFARVSNTPMSVRRQPPRLGADTQDILREIARAESGSEVSLPQTDANSPTGLPFAGLKVADFSWVGVGPITAKYLADHGATVVHVETANTTDIIRSNPPYRDNIPGINRSQFFGDFNTSKLGVTLDLKHETGLDLARNLIAWADVYIESFTPGTVDKLGIGYEVARSLNPAIIMASTCLMGQDGPVASLGGFGFHAAAIAGFFEVTGWPDLRPDGPYLAYTDTIAPRFLTATVLAALDRRGRTGQGQFIDCAQIEAALHFLSPQLIDYSATGRVASRQGNRDQAMAPHGVYPCVGKDQWCAIAVETDVQWQALKSIMALDFGGDDKLLDSLAGRLDSQDQLDLEISKWTCDRSAAEVMQILQAGGVPAGKVQRSSDLVTDPQLAHRGFFCNLERSEMGPTPYSGHQFRIRGYDSAPRFAAPLLGEHNDVVLREVLGLSDDDIAEALISGTLT